MNTRLLFSTLALAALSALVACGGGEAPDDTAQASAVGGISGSGASTQSVGGVSGSGASAQSIGGVSGSGATAQGVGGVSGSGIASVAAVHACALRSVNVTVAGVRANPDASASASDAGWVDVALAAPVRLDLMTLSGSGALPLDMTALPDGTYRQVRLILVADDANAPLANAVVTSGLSELALSVPGAAQGGLPLSAAITVAGGQVSATYADIDACAAVTATGDTYALGTPASGASRVASAN